MPDYHPLEPIITYEMNETEAKAFKVTLLWQVLSRKEFPDYKHGYLRKKGDPRKTLLFKYCYKLIQETKNILQDDEYKLYVLAQLRVLKDCTDGTVHAMITPQCLVGLKAWRRWSIWKKQYDKEKKELDNKIVVEKNPVEKVKQELESTKKFLVKMFGKIPDFEITKKSFKEIVKCVNLGRISPYFVLLSPYIRILSKQSISEVFFFDTSVYIPDINEEVRNYFDKSFN